MLVFINSVKCCLIYQLITSQVGYKKNVQSNSSQKFKKRITFCELLFSPVFLSLKFNNDLIEAN